MRESSCIPVQTAVRILTNFRDILTSGSRRIVSDAVQYQPQDMGATAGASKSSVAMKLSIFQIDTCQDR